MDPRYKLTLANLEQYKLIPEQKLYLNWINFHIRQTWFPFYIFLWVNSTLLIKIRKNFVHVLKTFYFIPQNHPCGKYVRIHVLSNLYFLVKGQNRFGLYTGKYGSEKTRFWHITGQKVNFSIKDFFSKCDQIRRKQQIWSHLLKKSLMEKFILCAM